jgi:hypothetical protein
VRQRETEFGNPVRDKNNSSERRSERCKSLQCGQASSDNRLSVFKLGGDLSLRPLLERLLGRLQIPQACCEPLGPPGGERGSNASVFQEAEFVPEAFTQLPLGGFVGQGREAYAAARIIASILTWRRRAALRGILFLLPIGRPRFRFMTPSPGVG